MLLQEEGLSRHRAMLRKDEMKTNMECNLVINYEIGLQHFFVVLTYV